MRSPYLGGCEIEIGTLIGKTLVEVVNLGDVVVFRASEDEAYKLYHSQDCCECVRVEEVIGDLDDLVGSPILEAEEVSSEGHPDPENAESFTWTFYKLGTIKGHVTIRWLGESNGYYSESVSFCEAE